MGNITRIPLLINSFSVPLIALTFFGVCSALKSSAQDSTTIGQNKSELKEFVVTGQYQSQSLRKSVYKVTVIDQKRIAAKAVNNAQQILSGELGIRFSNDMALGTADVSFMGMSGRNVKILLDGVPLLDRGDARESLNQINAAQIERIELVEGPMSIIYGSDALAGIINIITKKSDASKWQLGAQVTEETAGKEYDFARGKGLHTQQLSAAWNKGKFSSLVSIMHYDFGGFGSDSLNRDHVWKPKQQLLPSLRLAYTAKDWDVLYRNDYLIESITTKGKINYDTYQAKNQFYVTNRMAHQMQFNKRWNSKWFLNAQASYSDIKRYTKSDILDYQSKEIRPSSDRGEQDTALFDAFNVRTSLLYVAHKKLSIQPGLDFSFDKASGARIQGRPSVSNMAAFVTAEYKPMENISFRPGLRWNKNSLYDAPPLLPSLNILYRVNDALSLRASYAQGFRAPALRELYFEFKDANHNILGNKNLKAENAQSYNVSLAYRKPLEYGRMYATELGYFYNVFDNLISIAANPNNAQEFVMINLDNYRTSGLSMSNRFVTPKVEWRLGAMLLGEYNSYAQFGSTKAEAKLFNWVPEFNVEMMYQILATKTKINLFYKFTGKRASYTYSEDAAGNVQLQLGRRAAYSILDMNVQQQFTKEAVFVLGVRNLLNLTNIANTAVGGGSHSGSGPLFFSYGRSVFASIKLNITH